jgi:hypothetical protein
LSETVLHVLYAWLDGQRRMKGLHEATPSIMMLDVNVSPKKKMLKKIFNKQLILIILLGHWCSIYGRYTDILTHVKLKF